jgi:hypothetical protein
LQEEKGEYQRWLEKRAYDGILREKDMPPEVLERQLNALTKDKVRGVYAWGSEICCDTVVTEEGLAKFLSIILRDQGVDLALARRIAEKEFRRIVFTLFKAETSDPKVVEAAERLLGLTGSGSSSGSDTHPTTEVPKNSAG